MHTIPKVIKPTYWMMEFLYNENITTLYAISQTAF